MDVSLIDVFTQALAWHFGLVILYICVVGCMAIFAQIVNLKKTALLAYHVAPANILLISCVFLSGLTLLAITQFTHNLRTSIMMIDMAGMIFFEIKRHKCIKYKAFNNLPHLYKKQLGFLVFLGLQIWTFKAGLL